MHQLFTCTSVIIWKPPGDNTLFPPIAFCLLGMHVAITWPYGESKNKPNVCVYIQEAAPPSSGAKQTFRRISGWCLRTQYRSWRMCRCHRPLFIIDHWHHNTNVRISRTHKIIIIIIGRHHRDSSQHYYWRHLNFYPKFSLGHISCNSYRFHSTTAYACSWTVLVHPLTQYDESIYRFT